MLRRLRWALHDPAENPHLAGAVACAAALLVLVEVSCFPSKPLFVVAAAPTVLAALAFIYALSSSRRWALDEAIGRLGAGVGLTLRWIGRPSRLAVVLYCAGLIGSVAGFAYLALTDAAVTRQDVIVQWGLMDKRQLVFAYVVVVAFVVFHNAVVRLFFASSEGARIATGAEPGRRGWPGRLLGAVAIAALAYGWIGIAALREVVPGDGAALAKFYELHSHIHLAALAQIRLGAVPYLEAQTQYGLGNLLLLYRLTDFISFSNHGFQASVILVNVLCVVGFFVVVQQVLGFGWAVAGLVGWAIWPSPAGVVDFAGWAILTRWLAIPIVSLLLARLLLAGRPERRAWLAPLAVGAVWGAGAFMSQESLSGGLLVFVLSLALYGPVCGRSPGDLVRFAGAFFVGGLGVFLSLVAGSVGISHSLDVLRTAGAQSGLVMAGVSNSVWSEDVGIALRYDIVNGWPIGSLKHFGALKPLFQTYGFALLLMVAIGLLAGFLVRSWRAGDDSQRPFAWKFAGVTVGAYALHLFTLLRSDLSHLSGPSFLMPLFLLMLPVFAWRCLRPGLGRGLLLVVSVGLIVEATVDSRVELGRRVIATASTWRESTAAWNIYRELHDARAQAADPASRYTPITRYQAPFRGHPRFEELQELTALLHERLRGRPVELAFLRFDDLITDAEVLYFYGAFRSITGITSQKASLWLKADEDAWLDKILGTPGACVFFDARYLDGRLYQAWKELAKEPGRVLTHPIVGKRDYGLLSCKT